jgi:flagellar biosynthetic protein FliP
MTETADPAPDARPDARPGAAAGSRSAADPAAAVRAGPMAPAFGLRAAAGAALEDLVAVMRAVAAAARPDAEGPPSPGPPAPERAAGGPETGRAFAAPVSAPAPEAPPPRRLRFGFGGPRGAAAARGARAGAEGARGAARRWMRRLLWLLVALAVLTLAGPVAAQEITVDLGGGSLTARLAQLFVLITLLSLAPGLAIMVTCFPFMVTALSILRQAIGVQQAPPNMMIVSLALFLTYFVIEPVFQQSWEQGVRPLIDGEIAEDVGVQRAFEPFRTFMEGRVDPDTLAVMVEASPVRDSIDPESRPPVSVLIPAFLLSEIQRGFEVGFLIFLPFLIIDLVIASVLMSMGMMMVPPAVVALPFKLAFFVVADGWTLLAGALVRGYQ